MSHSSISGIVNPAGVRPALSPGPVPEGVLLLPRVEESHWRCPHPSLVLSVLAQGRIKRGHSNGIARN